MGEAGTPDDAEPAGPADEPLGPPAPPSFGDAGMSTMDYLAQQALRLFWLPGFSGFGQLQVPDGTGGLAFIQVPQFNGPTPLQQAANALWQAHGKAIMDALVRRVDLRDLVDQIAARVVQDITAKADWGSRLAPTAENIRNQVRDKVADKLTDRAVRAYDEQQSAMLAAWEREQARERQAAVAQGDGVEGVPAVGNDAAADAGDGRY